MCMLFIRQCLNTALNESTAWMKVRTIIKKLQWRSVTNLLQLSFHPLLLLATKWIMNKWGNYASCCPRREACRTIFYSLVQYIINLILCTSTLMQCNEDVFHIYTLKIHRFIFSLHIYIQFNFNFGHSWSCKKIISWGVNIYTNANIINYRRFIFVDRVFFHCPSVILASFLYNV